MTVFVFEKKYKPYIPNQNSIFFFEKKTKKIYTL